MSPWPSRLLGPLARSQDSSRASTLRRSNQRPGDQQESSCDSCEWTPLYERRAFRNAQVQRCVDVARVFRCARGKLLGEKVPSESRIFLKNRTRSPCCARRERPRCRRAAEQRHELATPHSITSSAMESTSPGMVRPSALAVLRLITNANLVAWITGRSPGLAPLSTRPV